jgi:hypothetical protein
MFWLCGYQFAHSVLVFLCQLVDVACVKPLSCTVLVGSTEFGYGPGRLNYPQSMCQPDANTLLIADRSNNRIRKLDLRTSTSSLLTSLISILYLFFSDTHLFSYHSYHLISKH